LDPTLTNSISSDVYQGSSAYLMGMAYYERNSRFEGLDEGLHKVHLVSRFCAGLSKIGAKRVNGVLPSGNITLIQPAVDMVSQVIVLAGNSSLRPDEGADWQTAVLDYEHQFAAHAS